MLLPVPLMKLERPGTADDDMEEFAAANDDNKERKTAGLDDDGRTAAGSKPQTHTATPLPELEAAYGERQGC